MCNVLRRWGWKRATDIDDAINFFNGVGVYGKPANVTRICAVSRPTWIEFFIYYRLRTPWTKGGWGWKLATDPTDVMNFVNGTGAYHTPVKDAHVCAVSKGGQDEFYVFYRK